MSEEVKGFVLKLGVELDTDDIKKLRSELSSLKKKLEGDAAKIGIKAKKESTESTGGTATITSKSSSNAIYNALNKQFQEQDKAVAKRLDREEKEKIKSAKAAETAIIRAEKKKQEEYESLIESNKQSMDKFAQLAAVELGKAVAAELKNYKQAQEDNTSSLEREQMKYESERYAAWEKDLKEKAKTDENAAKEYKKLTEQNFDSEQEEQRISDSKRYDAWKASMDENVKNQKKASEQEAETQRQLEEDTQKADDLAWKEHLSGLVKRQDEREKQAAREEKERKKKKDEKEKPPKPEKKPKPEKEPKGGGTGFAPFVQELSTMNAARTIGAAVGAGMGSIFGNAGGGAQMGAAILGMIKDVMDKTTQLVDARLTEDLKLEQFKLVLGKTKPEIYQLGEQARMAGGSLDSLVQTQKNFTRDIFTGINPIKAQMYALAGINIKEEYMKGGSRQEMIQRIFMKLNKAYSGLPPDIKEMALEEAGFSAEEQFFRPNLYNPSIVQRAIQNTNLAGWFATTEQTRGELEEFRGAEGQQVAAKRNLASTSFAMNTAIANMSINADVLKITASVVKIVTNAVTGFDENLAKARNTYENSNLIGMKPENQRTPMSPLNQPDVPMRSTQNILDMSKLTGLPRP